MESTLNNLARAQRAYDNVIPLYDDRANNDALKSAATAYLEALQAGKPDARMPLDGVTRSATIATLLTWLSADSSARLLAACSAAMQGKDLECAGLLKSFAAQAAAEYADDNRVAWL